MTLRTGKVGNCVAVNLRDKPVIEPQNVKEVLKRDTPLKILNDATKEFFEVETPWKNQGFVLKDFVVDIQTHEEIKVEGVKKSGRKRSENSKENTGD